MAKAMIHIADNKTDELLDFIPEEHFWNDERTRELKDNRDSFDFETFATESYAGPLEERNRVLIPDRGSGSYSEFIIEEARQVLDGEFHYKIAYTNASYLELRKQKQIPAQTITGYTPKQHVDFALSGTEWQAGNIEYGEVHTTVLTAYMDAYSYLLNIERWSGKELRFRVEHDGTRITGRYVDLVEREGVWRGHEAVLGKDLMGIERARKFGEVVTALIGLGPTNNDETPREEVYVESDAALKRWSRNGNHLVEVYEPESEDQDINPAKLLELTQEELNRRITHQSEYIAKIHTLAEVMGVEPTDLRFGDVIRVKDEEFNPPIYLEARIHSMKESIKDYGESEVTLGDYTEFSEAEVKSILKRLRDDMAKMVSNAEMTDAIASIDTTAKVTQNTAPVDTEVIWIDNSNRPLVTKVYIDAVEGWVPIMPATAEEIGADPTGSAANALSLARVDIAEVNDAHVTLRNEYDSFVSDGFITRSEAMAIERHISSLNAEKADVDADYTATYSNTQLGATEKTALQSAKTSYDTAHSNLITAINTVIADSYVTAVEKTQVDDSFVAYGSALGNYSTARADAGYAITAKEAADAKSQAITEAADDAAIKASEAQSAAQEYALAEAEFSATEAKAYADGIVTLEEQARIEEALAKLAEAKLHAEEKVSEAIAAIDNSDLATKEELEAQAELWREQLKTRGGANLVKNSVGYAETDFWQFTTVNETVVTIMNEALSAISYGSGFFFPADGLAKGIQQVISVEIGKEHTLSWQLSKASAGDFTVDVLQDGVVVASEVSVAAVGGGFTPAFLTFTPTTSHITIRFTGAGTLEATLTAVMLGVGNLPIPWSLATGELYNAYVRTDENGIVVLRLDAQGLIESKTVMSPEEFAGYYDENRDGNFERVFWLNQDETVTKKLRALREITMGSIKIVRIESVNNRGWAFVPIVPEE